MTSPEDNKQSVRSSVLVSEDAPLAAGVPALGERHVDVAVLAVVLIVALVPVALARPCPRRECHDACAKLSQPDHITERTNPPSLTWLIERCRIRLALPGFDLPAIDLRHGAVLADLGTEPQPQL